MIYLSFSFSILLFVSVLSFSMLYLFLPVEQQWVIIAATTSVNLIIYWIIGRQNCCYLYFCLYLSACHQSVYNIWDDSRTKLLKLPYVSLCDKSPIYLLFQQPKMLLLFISLLLYYGVLKNNMQVVMERLVCFYFSLYMYHHKFTSVMHTVYQFLIQSQKFHSTTMNSYQIKER